MEISNIKTDIKFRKSGIIELSAKVSKTLDIQPGDAINFINNEEECYIYVAHKAEQNISCKGVCYSTRKNSKHMRVSWKEMCTQFIKSDGRAKEALYRVGEIIRKDENVYLSIITRKNYASQRD